MLAMARSAVEGSKRPGSIAESSHRPWIAAAGGLPGRELGSAINQVRDTVASVGYAQSAAIEQLETSTTRAASETARAVESASQIPAFGGHDTLGGQVVEINRHLERISRSSR